jgi:hypothetical protein
VADPAVGDHMAGLVVSPHERIANAVVVAILRKLSPHGPPSLRDRPSGSTGLFHGSTRPREVGRLDPSGRGASAIPKTDLLHTPTAPRPIPTRDISDAKAPEPIVLRVRDAVE